MPTLRAKPIRFLGPSDVQDRFGRRLRDLRIKQGWTQLEMSVLLGIDRGHISELERGRKSVSLPTMEVFALGLRVSLSELLEDV